MAPPPRQVGRYLMFEVIASGGMAAVHYGLMSGPVGFRRTVAIKRLHEQFAEDPEFVSQFLDEARLAARIRHPNVVQTLDVVAEKRQLLLVMEYVDGETLARLVTGARKRGELVPIEQAVGIVTGALHGLHAAHEATDEHGIPLSIVHRDVSPQNILVGRDGIARVLDFGVAKAAARLHSTQGARIKGKIRYMSPEQIGGRQVDRRTDVFAAGTVLWQTLTGRRLFDSSEGPGAIINQVLSYEPPPPSKYRSDVHPALDDVVLRALSKDANERFATACDLAIALEEAVRLPSAHAAGQWVRSIAGDDLDERARIIARIERHSGSERESLPSFSDLEAFQTPTAARDEVTAKEAPEKPIMREADDVTVQAAPTSAAERSRAAAARRKLAAAAAALLALTAAIWAFTSEPPNDPARSETAGPPPAAPGRAPSRSAHSSKTAAVSDPPTTDQASEVPAESPEPAAAFPKTEESSPEKASDDAKAPKPPSSRTPATQGTTAPAPSPRAKTKPAPRPKPQQSTCANPTYVDEKGIRRFKVECL